MANLSQDTSSKLDAALKEIEKAHGKGAVLRISDETDLSVPRISSGSVALDIATGGGLPLGRVVEFYGNEGSGKSSISLQCIAEAQRLGGACGYCDFEQALDLSYAKNLGVDVKSLLISQPDNAEQGFDIAEKLITSGGMKVFVFDSTNAMSTASELEGEFGDAQMGAGARLLGQSLRKLTGVIKRTGTLVIFISQLRQKIGVTFGSNEVIGVGNAMKFFASMRIDLRRIEQIKKGDDVVGARIKMKVSKNKVSAPYGEGFSEIHFGKGFDIYSEVCDLAIEKDIIQKAGSWFSFGETRIGQGQETVREFFKTNPEIFNKIRSQLTGKEVPVTEDKGTDPESAPAPAKTRKVKTAPVTEVLDLDSKPTEEASQ